MIRAAYLAAPGFETPLTEELERRGITVSGWHGRLALSPDPLPEGPYPAWALDIWTDPREIPVPSVKAGADALRALQRNWSLLAVQHHRRAALLAERLPPVKASRLIFPSRPPSSHLGGWTLLEPDLMLASPTKTSPFVNGECLFEENRIDPPSRAYLKLWEALTHLGEWPKEGETCIDLGASPGGWSWVMATLGGHVTAIDKAPLAPELMRPALRGERGPILWQQGSAFALPPEPVDWLVSDVIAYPSRLLAMVERWMASGMARRIICTIKFQGPTDHDAAQAFAALPGGRVRHLFHNKHELTFLWRATDL